MSSRARFASSLILLAASACLSSSPHRPGGTADSYRLDWTARSRWVHVDHVAKGQVAVFEAARLRWLEKLGKPGERLPDGRPLFWSGEAGGSRVYFTFSPFAAWEDLAIRSAAIAKTEAIVGKEAVTDYDSGDVALVPPHKSEIWRRVAEMDLAPAGESISEQKFPWARFEYRRMPVGSENAEADPLWSDIQRAWKSDLHAPLCRAWWGQFGGGQLVLVCYGSDEESVSRPAAGLDRIRREWPDVAEKVDRLFALEEFWVVRRRPDLSNFQVDSAQAAP